VGRTDLSFDARLDILCKDEHRRVLGLGWIQPVPGARYVVVRLHGYGEAYEVTGKLPVRVPTDEVDIATSSATFRVEQYDARGRRLASRAVHASVAG
jgi:hypothetical protein